MQFWNFVVSSAKVEWAIQQEPLSEWLEAQERRQAARDLNNLNGRGNDLVKAEGVKARWLYLYPPLEGQPAPCLFSPMIWGACQLCADFQCVLLCSFFVFWSTPHHTPLIHFVLQICEHKHSEPAQYHLRAVEHLQNMATKVLEAGTRIPTIKTARLSNIKLIHNWILKYFWIS